MLYKVLYRGVGFTSFYNISFYNYKTYNSFDDIETFNSEEDPVTEAMIKMAENESLTVIDTERETIIHGTMVDLSQFGIELNKGADLGDRQMVDNPDNVTISPKQEGFVINYDIPITDSLSHIEIYADISDDPSTLDRSNAFLIYKGPSDNYYYDVLPSNLNKYHKFWVYCIPKL